nr:immunoglobulin heavy chain junction region [Macaca mulatta]
CARAQPRRLLDDW